MLARHARNLICALSLAGFWAIPVEGQRQSLTPDDIGRAIEWGQSGRPEGYPLRSAFPRNKTAPGAVYTPYLRVALAARAAHDEGRTFTDVDVTAEMTEPLMYFAIGSVGHNPLPTHLLPADTPLLMRLVTMHSHPGSSERRVIRPVWLRREVPTFLRYGLRSDWSYIFAAFRVEQVQADTRVELYRELREGSHREAVSTPGLITEDDLAAWR